MTSFLSRLRQGVLRFAARERDAQEQADVATALLLTTWWRRIALEGVEDRQALQAEAEAVEKLGGYQQTVALRKNLDEQVLRMFNAIHAARQAQSDPAKLRELTSTPGQANAAAAAEEEEDWRPPKGTRRQRQHHDPRGGAGGGDSVVTKLLRKELGFTLRVGPSTVPAAGRGVFLEGKARIGALVGLFPGLVYLPEHLKTPEDVQALFPDPDFFLFQRYDKAVIDSRAPTAAADAADAIGDVDVEGQGQGQGVPLNEYALAHMCNHGGGRGEEGEGGGSNVMAVAYNFPQDPLGWGGFPPELRSYIPNSYAKQRTLLGSPDQSALIHSVALIATTDVEDEELFLNYRLNPKHQEKLPPWYVPIDAEEDKRRWA